MNIGSNYGNYYLAMLNRASSLYSSFNTAGRSSVAGFPSASGSPAASSALFNKDLMSSSGLQYVQALKQGSADLKKALSALGGGTVFRQKVPVSSDSEVLTVQKGSGSYSFGSPQMASTITVDLIATGQVNEGASVRANELAGASGLESFSILVNGKEYNIAIQIGDSDTNQDVQNRIAKEINNLGIGVEASVKMDGGNSTLTIQSSGVGDTAANRFVIEDKGSGVLTDKFGVENTKQEAQDAVYRLNGGEARTSKSNTIDIGGGYVATLKRASSQTVSVSLATDTKAAVSKVKELADSYNKLYAAGAENAANDAKANRLFSQLLGVSKTYAPSLQRIGIGFDGDGRMVVDEKQAEKAAADGSLESFFTQGRGGSYGFANRLSSIADNVNRNTSQYVDQQRFAASLMDNTSYVGWTKSASLNSLFNIGILFDLMM